MSIKALNLTRCPPADIARPLGLKQTTSHAQYGALFNNRPIVLS
jgi:hypothetical protein